MKNQKYLTEPQENDEKNILYPILSNNKTKGNKGPNNNGDFENKIINIKNKVKLKLYQSNSNDNNNKKQKRAISLINSKPNLKKLSVQKMMNKNILSESNDFKNKTIYNKKYKNYSSIKNGKNKRYNKTIINNENAETKNNTIEIRDILNRLIKIKQKINEINIIKKKKVKSNFEKFEKLRQAEYSHTFKNFKIKCRNNNKPKIFEDLTEINKNERKNYKTESNFKMSKTKKILLNSTGSNQNKKYRIKFSLDNKLSNFNVSENNSNYKKEITNSADKKRKYFNYKNIITEHANYIDKIRDSEFFYLFDKFKRSMKKNKIEEINHKKSLVFPPELVNYIITMKNQLIIDKYKNEYLKKLDTYKYNTQKILKAIKFRNYYSFNNNDINKNYTTNNGNYELDNNKSNIKMKLAEKINETNIYQDNNNNDNDNYNYLNDDLKTDLKISYCNDN
jgi:hypothetical protein